MRMNMKMINSEENIMQMLAFPEYSAAIPKGMLSSFQSFNVCKSILFSNEYQFKTNCQQKSIKSSHWELKIM